MIRQTILLPISLALLSGRAHGIERVVQVVNPQTFQAITGEALEPNSLFYSEQIVPFSSWNGAEKELLNLFPGYQEPTTVSIKDGVRKTQLEKLTVYITKQRSVINKPAAQINLASLVNLDSVRKLDPEIKHVAIQAPQFIGNVAGRAPINNFKWCNEPGKSPSIFRPEREIDLNHTLSPQRPWCSQQDRSLCVESCYLFGKGWTNGVALANAAITTESEKKDYGAAFQAEVRYLVSEAELGNKIPLVKLTNLKTPVRGIVEVNMFYFNQIIQFGKVLAVFQEHPTDASKTVVTSFMVISVKTRTWEKYGVIKDVLRGKSLILNTRTGLTAGVPVFSQNFAKSMLNILEN